MINLRRSGIAGEYKATRQDIALTLRVDVGAGESLDIISGDLFFETGTSQFEFHHSFQTTILVLEEQTDTQMLRGPVKVHREDILDIARLDLEIPDIGELVATYTFYQLTPFGRQTAATFTFPLAKTSNFFRRVELEVDQVENIPLPGLFQTDAHPDTPVDVPPQTMTFQSVYNQTGVNLAVTWGGQDVEVNEAGIDGLWTDEELHAAMVNNFAHHQDVAQWRLYLLLATRYISTGVVGIMFDSGDDFPRQGSAVFYEHPAIKNAIGADQDREYLYTIVHELGHAFNFLHSFQKGIFHTHGVLPRPGSLSWMNYPQLFPFGYAGPSGWDGSSSYWSQFKFQFDRDELAHIRHNDSMEVIMGGRSFGFAGHLEERPFEMQSNEPNLSFRLWLPSVIDFMQQVEGDVRLRNESDQSIEVHPSLHPAGGAMELLIRRPTDRYPKVFKHFTSICIRAELKTLQPGEAIYQELSPSFGRRHWFFDEPGTYEVQAIYHAPDGRRLTSNIQKVRILLPSAEADRLAADFFSTNTGIFLGVEGSRIEQMGPTRDTLKDICQRIPEANIAKQVNIVNALRKVRAFKDVNAGKVIKPPDRTKATNQLLKALSVTKSKEALKVDPTQSHIRLSRYLYTAAQGYAVENDKDNARIVIGTTKKFLSSINAPKQATTDLKSFEKELKLNLK